MRFVLQWVLTGVAVSVAVLLVPGISVVGTQWVAVFLTALVLSLIDMSIKPILQLLSLPVTILTLGIFALILNALLLELASWLTVNLFGSGIVIGSFWSALLGSIIISIALAIINALTGGLARE